MISFRLTCGGVKVIKMTHETISIFIYHFDVDKRRKILGQKHDSFIYFNSRAVVNGLCQRKVTCRHNRICPTNISHHKLELSSATALYLLRYSKNNLLQAHCPR